MSRGVCSRPESKLTLSHCKP
eukprot:gene27389-biopygen10681